MNRVKMILVLICQVITGIAFGQLTQIGAKGEIAPLRLPVGYNKTTNLIFPYAIKSVDRGSRDVLIQKAEGVENVLQLKAANHLFKETNLTVITGEGALYSFLVNYAEEPGQLNLKIADMDVPFIPVAVFSEKHDNDAAMQDIASKVALRKAEGSITGDKGNGIGIDVNGIYIKEDNLYFRLQLDNATLLNYDIDQLRFYIRDKKKAKRTATQEIEVKPIYISGNSQVIYGNSSQVLVAVLEKFTIPDKKEMVVELFEKNGGRNLLLKLKNKKLIKAKQL
ncbi:MAG TPA: conjugative transposon protein TraN [Pseudosphingobacterium sp.]|nr:conjugative transposon protein TraN [Pseudosphingobacterium sp.]